MSDLISRDEAIDAMTNALWHYPNECYRNLNEYEFAKGLAELGLKSVPSTQPERKKGKWIIKSTNGEFFSCCSSCGHVEWYEPKNFCPNCGADMRGEQDE